MPPLPWDVRPEMEKYLRKRHLVSSTCRLTPLEEHALLCMCQQEPLNPKLVNRFHYLSGVVNGQQDVPVILPPLAFSPQTFDTVLDKSCLQSDESLVQKLKTLSYKRPKECKGMEALQLISRYIDHGVRLRGGKDELGFMFMYEMMTGTVKIKILEEDSCFNLAALLARTQSLILFAGLSEC